MSPGKCSELDFGALVSLKKHSDTVPWDPIASTPAALTEPIDFLSLFFSFCQQFAYFKPDRKVNRCWGVCVCVGGDLKDNLTHLSLNCTTAEKSPRTRDPKSYVHLCGLPGPKEGESIYLDSAIRRAVVPHRGLSTQGC